MLTLADILEALTGTRPAAAPLVISEASVDSRQSIPGSLFVAISGERNDGHDFISDAFSHGAHAALVQRQPAQDWPLIDLRQGRLDPNLAIPNPPLCLYVEDTIRALQVIARFWRRKHNLRVIGITGSVGKSTSKELIAEVLSQRYRTLKNPGNLNNEIGLPLTMLRLGAGHECAVLEMGFYMPGDIAFLCDLALPQVGVLTNIGTVHAERAGSQEAIARGKSELVQSLPPAPHGVAVLNYDDPWIRPMASQTQAQIIYYGLNPHADLWADNIEGLGLEGIRLRMHFHQEVFHLRVPMIGRHSVHTVLLAAAVGLVENLSWQEIISGLQYGHTQLRLVAARTENGALILDDTYNASPESTLAALNLLDDMDGRKVAVLGDMLELGPYEEQGHVMVGARAAEVCDLLIAVGERGRIIFEASQKAGLRGESVQWFSSVPEATEFLRAQMTPKDIILVKGSHGMRMDRIVTALEAAHD